MNRGIVKWYNETKGFGFILSEQGTEVFFHRSGLQKPFQGLQPDDIVVYRTKQGEKGLMAFDVEKE